MQLSVGSGPRHQNLVLEAHPPNLRQFPGYRPPEGAPDYPSRVPWAGQARRYEG